MASAALGCLGNDTLAVTSWPKKRSPIRCPDDGVDVVELVLIVEALNRLSLISSFTTPRCAAKASKSENAMPPKLTE